MPDLKVGVLGASSLVGRCLLTHLAETGCSAVAFSRKKHIAMQGGGVEWRQIQMDLGALAGRGDHLGGPAALACEPIDLAETQARALADRLGGEEGLEHPDQGIGVHARPVVGDGDADVLAGREVHNLARLDLAAQSLDRDPALVARLVAHAGHDGVAGVDQQVDQGRLEL